MEEVFSDDIQEEILYRLRVKDITRFKSVSKSWLSLISGSRFVKNHRLRNYINNRYRKKIALRAFTNCKRKGNLIFDRNYHMIGSSNGLVCVNGPHDQIMLLNPLTRQVKILQNPPSTCCFGFGYDSSIDDYKLLFGYEEKHGTTTCFQLLHLKSNIWKSIELVKDCSYFDRQVGILCNGALHWFVDDNQTDKMEILSFDLSKDKFQIIPQPDDPIYQYTCFCKLGVTEQDSLCIYRDCIDQMWVMKTYNVKQSWGLESVDYANNVDHFRIRLSPPHDKSSSITFCTSSILNAPIFVESLESPHVNNGTHTLVNMSNEFIWQDESLKS